MEIVIKRIGDIGNTFQKMIEGEWGGDNIWSDSWLKIFSKKDQNLHVLGAQEINTKKSTPGHTGVL